MIQKLFGYFGGYGFSGTMNFFTKTMGIPSILAFFVIFTEFFGSLALILGLFTRVSALGIFIVMAVATLIVHLPNGSFMNWNGDQKGEGYEYHIFAMVIAVILIVKGGGYMSIDSIISDKF